MFISLLLGSRRNLLFKYNNGFAELTDYQSTLSFSESVVHVNGLLSANSYLDFGAFSPFFCLYSFGSLSLFFRQNVESRVQLLAGVLVVVNTELVVVSGSILPLSVGLNIEYLHELANLNL